MEFTRTFHAVGQGAFYSEEIKRDDETTFRMVYDCGSKSLDAAGLKKRIKSDFANNMNVDLLFISHFDMDHINGVSNLNPKYVVVPFLSDIQIQILKLTNILDGNSIDIKLAENPQEVFPNSNIIKVLPETPEAEERINQSDFPIIQISDNNAPQGTERTIKSYTPIGVADGNVIWEYIPFNPLWDDFASKFKTSVEKEQLDWDKLTSAQNGKYVKKYFSVLKGIYNSLKSKNLHSLVVYSNSVHPLLLCSVLYSLNPYPCRISDRCRRCCCGIDRFHAGCLYFGDALIEQGWRDRFYSHLENTSRLDRVDTVQIPHHGSHLSNGQETITSHFHIPRPVNCVISVGNRNSYGHPSSKVIRDLVFKEGNVFLVTEDASSLLQHYGVL